MSLLSLCTETNTEVTHSHRHEGTVTFNDTSHAWRHTHDKTKFLQWRGRLGKVLGCRAQKQRKPKVVLPIPRFWKEMADPCSFSEPSQYTCTHISWFVNVLFEKQILDCRAELDFEVKENGVKTLVRFENKIVGFDFFPFVCACSKYFWRGLSF